MAATGDAARALDLAAFCRQGGELQGSWPVAGMQRLAGSLAEPTGGAVQWTARGSLRAVSGSAPGLWLHLQANAQVPLQCQRCLQTMTEPLAVDRHFHFVRDEALAAQLDEGTDDDVLALPQRLDLHDLLEDELILALPLVPRHAVCPQPLSLPGGDSLAGDEPSPNPFAALAVLRGRAPH